ncbi:hypothetical protein PIB30_040142 [Stylosanthes scabra]|uniref:CCHC-type domain-containing protein n=1 Tax=Stylosanthes scabra TaxID=79078 RepID=A0ABU6UF10_9FABA|nr:hypothetical protein [Stylosanthes scabra]
MDAIRATYDIHVNPVTSEEFWHPTEGPKPTAPRIVRPLGRPRKKRTEAACPPPQPVNGDKVRRTFQVTCSKCGEKGHYYKKCKGAPQSRDWQPKRKKPRMQKANANAGNTATSARPNAPKPTIEDVIVRARKQNKKMPKRAHVPATQAEEILVSQSAPPTDSERGSQPHMAQKFTIPVPPPQKIFRPPAPFGDVHFSVHPTQPAPPQPAPTPQQQAPPPNHQHPNNAASSGTTSSNPNALSQETIAAARGTTSERILEFMPTPKFRPPGPHQ